MTVKQISVFLENTSGRLADVTTILGDAGVNLRAITIADTADFGILRLIVNDNEKALDVLKKHGFTAKVTQVFAIEIEDKPGGLASIMQVLEKNGLNIEYLYATLERNKEKAVVIFRVEDIEGAAKVVEENNFRTLEGF
jgi:hypothetical protein